MSADASSGDYFLKHSPSLFRKTRKNPPHNFPHVKIKAFDVAVTTFADHYILNQMTPLSAMMLMLLRIFPSSSSETNKTALLNIPSRPTLI